MGPKSQGCVPSQEAAKTRRVNRLQSGNFDRGRVHKDEVGDGTGQGLGVGLLRFNLCRGKMDATDAAEKLPNHYILGD